jgi:RND family efflux transporter MFP subunit
MFSGCNELQSFEKVYAPFDGVVTARNVDTGQLIDRRGKELFHYAGRQDPARLRQPAADYSQTVKRGAKLDIAFPEHAGKTYHGTLVRTADAIDPVEPHICWLKIDVDNHAGELLPGSLAQVHFKTPASGPTFIVPAAALIFRKRACSIGTVVNGNVAHLVPVIIGEDDGANVQIVSGLNAGDQVIQDPPDSLIEGEKVHAVSPSSQSNAGGK